MDNRYVLAKAGIKTAKNLNKQQQNSYITKLFFERTHDQTLKVNWEWVSERCMRKDWTSQITLFKKIIHGV